MTKPDQLLVLIGEKEMTARGIETLSGEPLDCVYSLLNQLMKAGKLVSRKPESGRKLYRAAPPPVPVNSDVLRGGGIGRATMRICHNCGARISEEGQSRRFWTNHEREIVRDVYPRGGKYAVHRLLPQRSPSAIQAFASKHGITQCPQRSRTGANK